MHELGIVYEVIKIVDEFVVANDLTRVDKIILEIGQLSQTIPHFVEACYPAAVSDTPYQETKLEINVVPAVGACQICHQNYNVVDHRKVCPNCQAEDFRLVSGREFNIKEVVAY